MNTVRKGDYCSPWPCGEMAPSVTQQIVPSVALSINAFKKQDKDSCIMKGISKPHENDVLMGRGGNERLRVIARK